MILDGAQIRAKILAKAAGWTDALRERERKREQMMARIPSSELPANQTRIIRSLQNSEFIQNAERRMIER